MFRAHLFVLGLTVGLAPNSAYGQIRPGGAQRASDADSSRAVRDKARAHANAGFDAHDAGNHLLAAQHFSDAIVLVDVPTLRLGRGDALVALNRWLEAIADYEAAVAYVPSPTDSPAISEAFEAAPGKLAALKARLPSLVVRSRDPNASLRLDDSAAQPLTDGAAIPMNPGAHRVVVTSFGRTEEHDVQLSEGQRAEIHAPTVSSETTAPAVPATSAEPPTAEGPPRIASEAMPDSWPPAAGATDNRVLVAGAVSGVLVLGAVITGVMWLNERSELNRDRERSDEYYKTLGLVNAGLWAGAVVGAGVTSYFWLAPQFEAGLDAATGDAPAARFAVLPSGIIAHVGGRF